MLVNSGKVKDKRLGIKGHAYDRGLAHSQYTSWPKHSHFKAFIEAVGQKLISEKT